MSPLLVRAKAVRVRVAWKIGFNGRPEFIVFPSKKLAKDKLKKLTGRRKKDAFGPHRIEIIRRPEAGRPNKNGG